MISLNLGSALITFREGLEAALIVGIVLGYLTRIGQGHQRRHAWAGVLLASIVSILLAAGLSLVGANLESPYEQIFEGTTMLAAVAVLTWMIFWMRYQGRFIKRTLEKQVQSAVTFGAVWGIFSLTFFAVVREGVETALFLSASAFAADGLGTFLGAVLGLVAAIAVGYAIYAMSAHLDLRMFFDVTSVLLLVFAAGLFAHGIHEFQEIGWLPVLTTQAWNIESFLSNDSTIGSFLRALVGYNDSPSILEVIAYGAYWLIIVLAVRRFTQHLTRRTSETLARAGTAS